MGGIKSPDDIHKLVKEKFLGALYIKTFNIAYYGEMKNELANS